MIAYQDGMIWKEESQALGDDHRIGKQPVGFFLGKLRRSCLSYVTA